jgi:hypothetical protein
MKTPITTKQYFITLNTTYYLQTFSVLLFAAVVAFLINQRPDAVGNASISDWHTVVPVAMIISLATAYMVFRLLVGRIKANDPLRQKMPAYARAILIRSALLEIPGFLAAIAAYLSGKFYFLGAAVLIFVLFLILKPSRNSIATDLNLSPKEKALLEDDSALIAESNR